MTGTSAAHPMSEADGQAGSAIRIAVSVRDGDWPEGSVERSERAALAACRLGGAAVPPDGEISIVLASDACMHELNRRFRGQDRPTNVLSFPGDPPLLGDVVLACETVAREAADQNKRFDHHLDHLVVHGTLHLFGYDHTSLDDRNRMETLEIAVLDALGTPDPYVIHDEPN